MKRLSDSELKIQILELEVLLSGYSTRSVAASLATLWLRGADYLFEQYSLLSPLRQTFYLLSIMLNTPEPSDPKPLSDDALRSMLDKTSRIFEFYTYHYMLTPPDTDNSNPDYITQSTVASPILIDYINRSKNSGDYERALNSLHRYFSRFDRELLELTGVSATDVTNIIRWVEDELQNGLDSLNRSLEEAMSRHARIEDKRGDNYQTLIQNPNHNSDDLSTIQLQEHFSELFTIRLERLTMTFGQAKATAFWKLAVSLRDRKPKLHFPTEKFSAEYSALFECEKGVAICPVINSLAWGMPWSLEDILRKSKWQNAFLRHRDKTLEQEVEEEFLKLFDIAPTVYRSAFEQLDSQYEHDLIVVSGDVVFIIECKASRARPPIRSVSDNYVRQRDTFRSDSGIQKAFDQGNRVVKKLREDGFLNLFDRRGNLLACISSQTISDCFVICVTRESWGFLATDLSSFLQKGDLTPFPWCVSIDELSAFVEGIRLRGWGEREFCDYLIQRAPLHGRVRSDDELNFAGAFLDNGFLPFSTRDGEITILTSDFSSVFDRIWRKKYGGTERVFVPGFTNVDVKHVLGISGSTALENWKPKKRCFCGSGRMYKNCCRKMGIVPPVRQKSGRSNRPSRH